MKQILLRLREKIDGLALRQRLLVFLAAAVAMGALADVLFYEPLRAGQKRLGREMAQSYSLLGSVYDQIRALGKASTSDPDAENKKRLAELRRKLTQTDASLLGLQQKLVTPDKMASLLEDILRKNGRLQLIAMQSLPASALLEQADSAAGGEAARQGGVAGKSGTAAPKPGKDERRERVLYKQGVQITLRGSYADLLQYLTMLENLPWQMYWGKASFKVERHPAATLTFTVYTLSTERAWLSV